MFPPIHFLEVSVEAWALCGSVIQWLGAWLLALPITHCILLGKAHNLWLSLLIYMWE